MTELILGAIIAVGSITTLVLWLFKRYWSADAKKRAVKKQLEEIRESMHQALLDGRDDDYARLRSEREQLHKELRNLR